MKTLNMEWNADRGNVDIEGDLPWWIIIDWAETADNVAMDYTTIEADGNTWYMRC